MHAKNRSIKRMLIAAVLTGTLILCGQTMAGSAQSTVTIADPEPDGVSLNVWASAEIDSSNGNRLLMLEGLAIGSCAVAETQHELGPILVFAESYEVTIRFSLPDEEVDQLLTQGESVVVPANTSFTLSNGMVDSAYPAEVILLAITDANPASATSEPVVPAVSLADSLDTWPETSSCASINPRAVVHPTFKVAGVAGLHSSTLYLGLGTWEPGATTDGYVIADEAASFNVMILAGGMDNAGFGTGRAFHAGPRQVLKDAFDDRMPHTPFANKGTAPVIGIVFGTAPGDGRVWTVAS